MTFKPAVNDANEHRGMNATADSWRSTGKAIDRLLYFGTSLPRLTHKLLYTIAYTTQDNPASRANEASNAPLLRVFTCSCKTSIWLSYSFL